MKELEEGKLILKEIRKKNNHEDRRRHMITFVRCNKTLSTCCHDCRVRKPRVPRSGLVHGKTGTNAPVSFTCGICDQEFATQWKLTQHKEKYYFNFKYRGLISIKCYREGHKVEGRGRKRKVAPAK